MSAFPSGSGVAARLAPAKPGTRGFLHIVRHGAGVTAIYVITYHRLDRVGTLPKPVLAEGAQQLIELLERIGVDFHFREMRGAPGNIFWLSLPATTPPLPLAPTKIGQESVATFIQ